MDTVKAGVRHDDTYVWGSFCRLRSFLDMVILEARPLLNTVLGLAELERFIAKRRHVAATEISSELKNIGETLADDCEKLRLQTPADAARGISNAKTTREIEGNLEFIRNAILIGLNRRKFFEPEPVYIKYFENPKLFGDAVFTAFPSATDDIAEAGTCLAFERSTACVMHLMRVTEAGLRALATAVGVSHQNDWGAYIREIYKELERQVKSAGAQSPDHQFYAEAAAQIDNVKRAWRNPTMHVDKSYSQPRAEEILLATKSLMIHLAARISE
jgi:hypothetical protein